MYGANAFNAYKSNSVNYASKEQLLLMLLEGACKYVKIGRQAIIDRDINKAHENLIKTQNIFYELMVTLDVAQSSEWGQSIYNIYDFIVKKLTEANIKKDINIIDEVVPLIEDIKDLWNEAYKISKENK